MSGKNTSSKRPKTKGLPEGFTESEDALYYKGLVFVKVKDDELTSFLVGVTHDTRKEAERVLEGRSLPGWCMDWVHGKMGNSIKVTDFWAGHNNATSETLKEKVSKGQLPAMSSRFLPPGSTREDKYRYVDRVIEGGYYGQFGFNGDGVLFKDKYHSMK